MTGGSVRGILDGKKTQTRRVMKVQPLEIEWKLHAIIGDEKNNGKMCFAKPGEVMAEEGINRTKYFKCPYQVGEKLWVRESWGYHGCTTGGDPEKHYSTVKYHADGLRKDIYCDSFEELCKQDVPQNIKHKKDCDYDEYESRWRCYCFNEWWEKKRKITPIYMPKWAARIWLEITGVRVERVQDISQRDSICEGIRPFAPRDVERVSTIERKQFAVLWDSINAKRGYGWESNPFVWIIEFKRCEK